MLLFWISTLFIGVCAFGWLVKVLASKEDWRLFSPFGVLMLCFLFYCSVGPWVSTRFTDMAFLTVDFYDHIGLSAGASLLSFLCVCLGYRLVRKRGQVVFTVPSWDGTFGHAMAVYFGFFFLFVLSYEGNFAQIYNIFGGLSEQQLGGGLSLFGFQQYFYLMISSCVAPVVLMWAKSSSSLPRKATVLGLLLNLLMIFMATGFRLRIVFCLLALVCLYFLRLRSSPRWFSGYKVFIMQRMALFGLLGGIFIVSMSTARKYGQGLDLEALKQASPMEMMASTFNDSVIYFCGGQVIHHVGSVSGTTKLETFKAAALRMIPQQIIGEKPLPKTIEIINEAMGGDVAASGAGFAVPCYVEYYISFGWFGVIVGSLLLGVAAAKVANLAIAKPTAFNLLFYALMTGFAFIYFHRGYFPQQLDYFMFMVGLPMAAFWGIRRRRA